MQKILAPLLMLVAGALLGLGFFAARILAPGSKAWDLAGSAMGMVGLALVVFGLVSLFFKLATSRSYEWLIAWRYLRVQHKRSKATWITFFIGLGMIVIATALMVLSSVWQPQQIDGLSLGPSHVQRVIQSAALGLFGIAHWVLFFGFLLLYFSLFTTISIFTVFIGLEALVAVLSMMGGFENDLREKILGATAHVVVSRPKKVFSDYREVLQKVSRMDMVVAASPYLESEVMITSQTNLSGVMLRGIDPGRITRVTDLKRFMSSEGGSGKLDNLLHPERLAKIPESRFRPLISPPMGPDDEKNKKNKKKKKNKSKNKKKKVKPGDLLEPELWDVEDEIGKEVPPRPLYPGIIIGAELAKNLRLYVGDDVNVVAPLGSMSPAGPIPKSKPFRVAGIFYSGLYEYDNKFAYVLIPSAQRFLGLEDEITGIEIKVARLADAEPVALAIQRRLGDRRGHLVETWSQRNVNLFSALKLEKLVMFIVLTFIVLVASFSIVTNLNMVVLEKVREIAVLKAMGSANGSVLKIFLYSGLYIGLIGMIVGVLSGVGICVFLAQVGLPLDPEIYYISQLPVRMNPRDITIVGLSGVALSFLATIYPSMLAARLKPADGLRRHET